MKRISKKIVILILSVSLVLGIVITSALAATLLEGENGNTIYMTMKYSNSYLDEESAITSVNANDDFYAFIKFSNNPTQKLEDSIEAYDIMVGYDQAKMTPTDYFPGDYTTTSVCNLNFAEGVVYTNWASLTGIADKFKNIQAEGCLGIIKFHAKQALTAEDLKGIKYLKQAQGNELKTMVMGNGRSELFTVVSLPDLDVQMAKTTFDSKTPLGLIKQNIQSVTFTDEDLSKNTLTDKDYTVTVKGGGDLSTTNNVIVVTYNGYSTEVELNINAQEYQKEDAEVTLDLGTAITKTYGDTNFTVTAKIGKGYNNERYTWSVMDGDAVTIASGSDTKAATLHINKAGLATVKLSYESEYSKGEAEIQITVNKKAVTITAQSTEINVGQDMPELKLTYKPADVAGETEFADITAVAVGSDGAELNSTSVAGEYTVKFKKGTEIYGEDKQLTLENYEVTLNEGKLKIKDKEKATVTVTGSADSYKYGEDPITLTAKVDSTGTNGKYTWTLASGEGVVSITSDGGNTATATILKSGTATVRVAYDSVSSKGEGTIELVIGKAGIVLDTSAAPKSVRVGGADPQLSYSVTGLIGTDTITDLGLTEAALAVKAYESGNGTTEYVNTSKAGSYVVKFANKDNIKIDITNEKYELKEIKETGTFSVVLKEPVTVTLQGVPEAIKYGDKDFIITAKMDGTIQTGTYTWESSSPDVIRLEGSGSSVTAKVLKAGSATISVTFESEDCLGEATTELQVTKIPLTITAGTYDMYEESKLETIDMKPTFDGFIAGEDATKYPEFSGLTVSAVKDNDEKITDADVEEPNEYVVKFFNGSDVVEEVTSENYEVTLMTGKLTVKAKEDAELTFSGAAETYTYGDMPISLSASVKHEGENGGFKWTSSNSDVIKLSSEEGSRVTASILKSGEATITVTYDSVSHRGTATITINVEKAVVNVEIDSAIIKVGDELPTLSYTVTGLVGEDTLSDLIESNTLEVTTEADGKTAGEFDVKFEQELQEKANDKYTLGTVTQGTLKVVDKEKTEVTISGKTEYSYSDTGAKLTAAAAKAGEADKKYTWKSSDPDVLEVTGGSDGQTATLTFHKAGKATVTVTYESDTTFGVSEDMEITVNKAQLTVRPKSQNINVGGTLAEIEAEFVGLKTGDEKSAVVLKSGELDKFVITDKGGKAVESINTSANGEYTVKFAGEVSFLESDKYEIKIETGTITVKSSGSSGSGGGTGGTPTPQKPEITVKPGNGGTITKSKDGTSFTIKPNKGYVIDDVIVDGKSVGRVFTYHFSDTSKNHTIEAKFVALSSVKVPFTDVGSGDWFLDDVAYVYAMGLMNGTDFDKFSPDTVTSRGMLVTILYRLEGEPNVGANIFTDVAADQYYTDGVAWAAANGIVNGYGNGQFGPDDDLTREQMVTIMYRYAKYKGYDMGKVDYSGFSDASKVSDFAADAMGWAIAHNIINGVENNNLAPQDTANRDQLAAVLRRFCDELIK